MTPDMMVVVDYEGKKLSGDREASSELPMHLEIYRNRPDVNAVVHAHPPTGDRLRRRGHSADARRARRGDHDARQHSDRGVRHAFDRGAAGGGPQVHQGARRDAARQPWRGDVRQHVTSRATTRWRRSSTSRRSAWWRGMLGRENLISRDEVERLQGLRGMYGIAAPAPLCADPADSRAPIRRSARCSRRRFVDRAARSDVTAARHGTRLLDRTSRDGEIRLTYARTHGA